MSLTPATPRWASRAALALVVGVTVAAVWVVMHARPQ